MLSIKDPETDRLARLTGESLTQAVRSAVAERLEREERHRDRPSVEHLMAIARRYASRPVIDDRSPDEIIGYDERGLPRRWWSTRLPCSLMPSSKLRGR